MPFTNFAIYFRTATTHVGIVPDPANLNAAQVIHFNDEDARMTLIKKDKGNNVSFDPTITANIKKILNVQSQGALLEKLTVTLEFTKNDSRLKKLEQFMDFQKLEPLQHKFGMFGVAMPTSTHYEVLPTNLIGANLLTYESTYLGGAEIETVILTIGVAGNLERI